MNGRLPFSTRLFCTTADNQRRTFTNLADLDKLFLGSGFRPASVDIRFFLNLKVSGRVETDASVAGGEVVVIMTDDGEHRVPRGTGEHEGLSAQWDRDDSDIRNFILRFGEDVREGLTDRRCVWVTPGVTPRVHFRVYPTEFGAGETISEIIEKARAVVSTQLLTYLPQAA